MSSTKLSEISDLCKRLSPASTDTVEILLSSKAASLRDSVSAGENNKKFKAKSLKAFADDAGISEFPAMSAICESGEAGIVSFLFEKDETPFYFSHLDLNASIGGHAKKKMKKYHGYIHRNISEGGETTVNICPNCHTEFHYKPAKIKILLPKEEFLFICKKREESL